MAFNSRCGAYIIAMALALGGCQATGFKKEDIGTAAGGIAGALLGNALGEGSSKTGRMLATVAGAAAGGYIGKQVGAGLDVEDQRRAAAETARVLAAATLPEAGVTAGFVGSRGEAIEIFESDAKGGVLVAPPADVKKAPKTTAKKQVAKKQPKPLASGPTPEMMPAAGLAPAALRAAVGDCKYVTQRVTLPDGTGTTEVQKFCLQPAPVGWKRFDA